MELGSTGHSCSDGNTYGNAYPTTDAYAEISAHAQAVCYSAAAAVAGNEHEMERVVLNALVRQLPDACTA